MSATLSSTAGGVQHAVELRGLGAGTASVNFFRTLGSPIGVAVFGAVLTRQLTDAITSGLVGVELPDGVTADTLTQDPRALSALTGPLCSVAIVGLSDAITTVFAVAAAVVAIGAIAAITIRELPLRDTATLATAPTPFPEPA